MASATDPQIFRLIAEVVERRGRGEDVDDAEVIASHPELMPKLREELDALRMVQQAFLAAQRAGPISEPLEPVNLRDIDAPLDDAGGDEHASDDGRGGPDSADPRPPARRGEGPPVPRIVGYRLLRKVSSGGQATVFGAVHEATGRRVAVKVLPGGPFATSVSRSRFDREADVLAALHHPHIVGILDKGYTADGSLFLTTPFVEAVSLDVYAARSRLTDDAFPKAVLELFLKIASAVEAAHESGVIHRDIKPSNVLVDVRGDPYLLDFGLASLRTAIPQCEPRPGRGAATLTHPGQIVGSIPWTSPEQATGGSARADERSDVYSLGACLYDALTGRSPFPDQESVTAALACIATVPPLPMGRAKRRFRRIDADALEAVVLRTLEKSQARRHPSVLHFANDLRAVLAGRPVHRAIHLPRRHERVLWGGIALGIAAAGASVVAVRHELTRDSAVVRRHPPVRTIVLPAYTHPTGIRFLRISPGAFWMGTAIAAKARGDDEYWHEVEITRPFWMADREVTRGQYRATMGRLPAGVADGDDDLPVTNVNWDDAMEFCRLLTRGAPEGDTYRLPTEAEWEYACRAGTGTAWAGNDEPDQVGWHAGNAGGTIHRPAMLSANHWGLYDLHGNAAEWCLDDYTQNYPSNRTDPFVRDSPMFRVIRGGSYRVPDGACRSGVRDKLSPSETRPDLGFRVVRGVAPATRPGDR